jgi:hypothetical protein
VRGGELDLGADAVTVASMASQGEREPVVSASGFIAQNMCGSVIRSDDGIDAAVVVHVPDGHSACNPRFVKDGARPGGDVDKSIFFLACNPVNTTVDRAGSIHRCIGTQR